MLEIEAEWRRMQEEWTDVYDKFRRLHMRVAKQVQRLDEESPHEGSTRPNGGEEATAMSPGNVIGNPSSLSERQRLINQQILARRNRRE